MAKARMNAVCKRLMANAENQIKEVAKASNALEKCKVKGGNCQPTKEYHGYEFDMLSNWVEKAKSSCPASANVYDLYFKESLMSARNRVAANPSSANVKHLMHLEERNSKRGSKKY